MKRYTWNVALFLIGIAGFSIMNLLFADGQKVSELEKRATQPRPVFSFDRLAEGTFFKEYDNFFADHFVFRTHLVQLGGAMKSFKGLSTESGASLVVQKGGNNMGDNLAAPSGKEAGKDGAVPASANDQTQGKANSDKGQSSEYLIIDDKAMLLYKYSAASAEAYAAAINHLRKSIDPAINVYSMLVPSQVEFIESEKFRKLSDSEKKAIDHVYELLDPGVTAVHAYDKVQQHTDEYVYFRTDHHWTALGAYYGYQAFAEATGDSPIPLSKYTVNELPDFLGSSYSSTLSNALKNNPDTIATYVPFVNHRYHIYKDGVNPKPAQLVESKIPADGRGGYAVFMGGDFPLSRIETDTKNGKRLLVIKDSYANAFVPFLLPHFEEIEIVDPRYFKGNLITEINNRQITDVLLVNGPVVTTYSGIAKLIEEKLAFKA